MGGKRHYLSDNEFEEMRMSQEVTKAIAFGVTIETTIYRRQDYCPRVHVLAVLSSGFAIVEVLEGEEKGEVMAYALGGNQFRSMYGSIKSDLFTERISRKVQV